jgi:hypothetical protein
VDHVSPPAARRPAVASCRPRSQMSQQHLATDRADPVEESRVDDEERHYPAGAGSHRLGRIVVQTQVSPELDDGGRHSTPSQGLRTVRSRRQCSRPRFPTVSAVHLRDLTTGPLQRAQPANR